MTRLGALFVVIFFISCSHNPKISKADAYTEHIYKLYLAASDKTNSLDSRYQLVNEGYQQVKYFERDSLFSKLLYLKSILHLNRKEFDSLLVYNRRLERLSALHNDRYYLGKAKYLFGYYFSDVVQESDSAFYYYNQSKNVFLQLKDSNEIGKRYMSMGIIQHDQGDYFGAKESLSEALRYLNPMDNIKFVASTYNELGSNLESLSDYNAAIENYVKAIEITPFQKDRLAYKNNLAVAYRNNEELKRAEKLFLEISKDTLLKKGSNQELRVLDNLWYTRWLLGEPGVHKQLKNVLELRKENKDRRGQLASYMHLGAYYSKDNKMVAKLYLDSLVALSRTVSSPRAEKDALKLLMTLEPDNISLRDRYINLQDSLVEVGLQVKTQFAKMKYDDEEKQLSILKLETEKELKNAELAAQRTQKTLWLILSTLLAFGGIGVFYGLRQAHKKERALEVYATEKRLAKKVHDELANDIYGVMTHIEHGQNSSTEDALNKLEDLYERTRNISHETGTIDTQNFQDELKKLLSQFRNDNTAIVVKGLKNMKWERLANEKKITLYRVLSEFLVNMKKHSGASLVSISFENLKRDIRIEYKDNGTGLPKSFKKGVGLSNTETRIKNCNGTFSFDSEPGKGLRILCAFPR